MLRSRWSDADAREAVDRWGPGHGEDLALRTYSARLLGAEPTLVRHGGGNTSWKGPGHDTAGLPLDVLWIKASGRDLATIEPDDHVPLDLERLRLAFGPSSTLDPKSDDRHLDVLLRSRMLDPTGPAPSLETAAHALVPGRFVDHTHPDDLLALSHRSRGRDLLGEALGDDFPILPYETPGLPLALQTAKAVGEVPGSSLGIASSPGALVWFDHGALTWADDPRESYERMIELAVRCSELRARLRAQGSSVSVTSNGGGSRGREPASDAGRLAVRLRGLLSPHSGDERRSGILRHRPLPTFVSAENLDDFLGSPLAADHVVHTGPWPVGLRLDERESWQDRIDAWSARYAADLGPLPEGTEPPLPRTALVPGLGVFAAASTAREADRALDLLLPSLEAQHDVAASGEHYVGFDAHHLANMDRRAWQTAKTRSDLGPLQGRIALVTGAAGAIGAGLARTLLDAGAHVALADLPGEALETLVATLEQGAPGRVATLPFDVTDGLATDTAFDDLARLWGGLDLLVLNAGRAHVAPLEELDPERFRALQAVNTEGTLHGLRAAARLFRIQGVGGDVVLISTKNVFAPGASFGAYSATKAAAHQLARIASQELAALDVRVNMVAPDAVFGGPDRPSGLWQEVGPSRMKARGLAADELQEYYRGRNLLQARVLPRHVGEAVLFFAERKTPTTGATLPVDGGLPDATPR